MTMDFPSASSSDKRLVVEIDGLSTIVGLHASNVPVNMVLPLDEEGKEFIEVGLIKVKRRFALYKPILAPNTGRLNDFHPEQR